MEYASFNSSEPLQRKIEPVGIYHEFNYWYTIAFCHLRNDYRHFRTDRISKIALTDESFKKEHYSLKEYLERMPENENLETVVIRVNKPALRFLLEQKYFNGFVSETDKGETVEMTFLSASLDAFARWYITFADQAELLTPKILQDKLKTMVSNISSKF
jgi:predicted DNA-binding transcriptional regulator YafY